MVRRKGHVHGGAKWVLGGVRQDGRGVGTLVKLPYLLPSKPYGNLLLLNHSQQPTPIQGRVAGF